jgi:hypothetical protein
MAEPCRRSARQTLCQLSAFLYPALLEGTSTNAEFSFPFPEI